MVHTARQELMAVAIASIAAALCLHAPLVFGVTALGILLGTCTLLPLLVVGQRFGIMAALGAAIAGWGFSTLLRFVVMGEAAHFFNKEMAFAALFTGLPAFCLVGLASAPMEWRQKWPVVLAVPALLMAVLSFFLLQKVPAEMLLTRFMEAANSHGAEGLDTKQLAETMLSYLPATAGFGWYMVSLLNVVVAQILLSKFFMPAALLPFGMLALPLPLLCAFAGAAVASLIPHFPLAKNLLVCLFAPLGLYGFWQIRAKVLALPNGKIVVNFFYFFLLMQPVLWGVLGLYSCARRTMQMLFAKS